MQVNASQKTRRKLHRMLFERIKESDGEHVANLYVKQRPLRHKSYGIVN